MKTNKKNQKNDKSQKLDVDAESNLYKRKDYFRNIQLVMLLVFVCAALFVLIYRYGQMIDLKYDINSLNIEYRDIKAENSALYAQLDKHATTAQIKEYAETRLNMKLPSPEQIVELNVRNSDRHESSGKNSVNSRIWVAYQKIEQTLKGVWDLVNNLNK